MSHGDGQRRALSRAAAAARRHYEDAAHQFRTAQSAARTDRPFLPPGDWLARDFLRADGRNRDRHFVWGYVLAAGRAVCAGQSVAGWGFLGEAPQLAHALRALARCHRGRLEQLVIGIYEEPPRADYEGAAVHNFDELVRDALDLRWAHAGASYLNDYQSYRLERDMRRMGDVIYTESFCRHLHHEAGVEWDRADGLLRELVVVQRSRAPAGLTEDTRQRLWAERFGYAVKRYERPDGPALRYGTGLLPFVMEGTFEGEDPAWVRAGLARTAALARGAGGDFGFGEKATVPNGVLADWCEEKGYGPKCLLEDLRAAVDVTYCPTYEAAEYLRSFQPEFGPGW